MGHSVDTSLGGLIYIRARYYDPVICRFISEDPSGNGQNWYTYCNDNPVNFIDQNGQNPWMAAIALILVAIIIWEIYYEARGGKEPNSHTETDRIPDNSNDELMLDFMRNGCKENELPEELRYIDYYKEHGDVTTKIAAHEVEIDIYLATCYTA